MKGFSFFIIDAEWNLIFLPLWQKVFVKGDSKENLEHFFKAVKLRAGRKGCNN